MELKLLLDGRELQGKSLLIVPYGIETLNPSNTPFVPGTFNRTLWN